MRITLQTMSILNFKGIRDLTVDFNEESTQIMGANATGKTSVFDAFTWLLFGKDSSDRKDFNLKTIDPETQQVIEKLPHEVSAVLSVGGNTLTLRKVYSEKWTKKRGSAVEEFTGHEVTQFVNDVPCGAREYQKEIENICPEHIFKLITNPLYFPNQKKDVQRQTLFAMAGSLTDEEIASTNADFVELIAQLTGKTLEGYKKEIAVKKKRIKDEIAEIPGRVDERKRSTPEEENWTELESELASKRKMIADIDAQMLDKSKALNAANQRKQELMKALNNLKTERTQLEYNIKAQLYNEHREANSKKMLLQNDHKALVSQSEQLKKSITLVEQEIATLSQKRESLIAEWKQISASTLEIDEANFVCPTCKRTLEVQDIEAKSEELSANFNTRKSQQLDDNKRRGMANKQSIEDAQSRLIALKETLQSVLDSIAQILASPEFTIELVEPDANPAILAHTDYINLSNRITDVENQLEESDDTPETEADLAEGKTILSSSIEELTKRLSKRDTIIANQKRIAELESEQRTLAQELATLEGIEFTIAEFAKAKIEAVEDKINALFDIVRFKMYEQQINGGEVETCEAMVDGVPFSDLNTACKINAGLDIINAICKYNEVNAPIFIDNAESVNALRPTDSQMVELIVTEDEELVIE